MSTLVQCLKTNKWVLISSIGWLIICQLLFTMIQTGVGQKVVDSVENQLRQELDFSDFHYLARSITDYNTKGAIKCSKITKTYPENLAILDLKYMSDKCSTNSLFLNGLKYNVELKALNGDAYQFEFIALNPILFYLALWCFRIIGLIMVILTFQLFKLKEDKNKMLLAFEKNIAAAILTQAQQVAHDIRSPLSALNLMIPSMNVLPEDNRVIIRQAIQRINDIANDLLNKKNALDKTNEASQNIDQSTPSNAKINSSASVFLLAPVIDAIVSEKRIQYRDKINVQIDIDLTDSYGLFINFNLVELKRIISNLINNSIEALLNNSGRINVKILSNKKSVFIQITDTGQGIPPQVLKTLGNRGVSYNKENSLASGSGLGLYHAKTTIEQLGGKFEMQSELGLGTQISIGLPLSNPPEWYLDKINITEDTLVVSVDDDVSIHGIWRNRFSSLATFENQTAQAIEFLSFTSVTDFMNWYKIQEISQLKKCIFFIDYEFIQQNMNGLELVEKLNLHLNPTKPILVTSRYDDLNIQEKCRKLNMKLIPKSMSGLIPLSIEKTKNKFDWILIDDDNLIHQTWALQARETNKKFIGYLNFDEFKRNINLFNYESTIYIDSMLGRDSFGNEVKGESLAEELFLSGFENIYITTGHSPEFIKSNQYIKGVLDKNPPNFKLHPT